MLHSKIEGCILNAVSLPSCRCLYICARVLIHDSKWVEFKQMKRNQTKVFVYRCMLFYSSHCYMRISQVRVVVSAMLSRWLLQYLEPAPCGGQLARPFTTSFNICGLFWLCQVEANPITGADISGILYTNITRGAKILTKMWSSLVYRPKPCTWRGCLRS